MTRAIGLQVREAVAFAGVGGVAFLVQLLTLNELVTQRVGPLTANAVAMLLSCAVAYAGNRWLSFRHRRSTRIAREAAGFLTVNAVTFLVGEAVLGTAYLAGAEHDRLAVNALSAAGIVLGTLMRFWAYRRFVFVADAANPPAPAPELSTAGTR